MTTSDLPSPPSQTAGAGPSRGSKVWLSVLGVALVVVIVGVIVFVRARQQGQSIVLPDGTKLTIAAVLHDGEREYKPPSKGLPAWIRDNLSAQWARRVLPRTWMNPVTFNKVTNTQSHGITVVFATQIVGSIQPAAARQDGPFAAYSFCLMDREAEFMGTPEKIDLSQNLWDPNGVTRGFAAVDFAHVPNALRSLEIGVFLVEGSERDPSILGKSWSDQKHRRIGSLFTANPIYQTAPSGSEGPVETLPTSRSLDGVTVTVERALAGAQENPQTFDLEKLRRNPDKELIPYKPNFDVIDTSISHPMPFCAVVVKVAGPSRHDWAMTQRVLRRFNETVGLVPFNSAQNIEEHYSSSVWSAREFSPRRKPMPLEVTATMRRVRPIVSAQKYQLVIPVPALGATQTLPDTWMTSGVMYSFHTIKAPNEDQLFGVNSLQLAVTKYPSDSPLQLKLDSVDASPKRTDLRWAFHTTTLEWVSPPTQTTSNYIIMPDRFRANGEIDYSRSSQPLTPADRPTSLTLNFVVYEDTELKFVVMPEDVRDRAETTETVAGSN